ncbi:MAG TPA: XRE family transcriptional regulator, partial [Methylophaga sp.]|nr:XRE family transcriptional regulator [Methylophaga sp.]
MISNESVATLTEELGERLKQARLNQDLTQAELAKRVGVTRKMV